MNEVKIICGWDLKLNFYHEKNVEVYVNEIPNTKKEDVIRFVLIIEPPEISNLNNQIILSYNNGYFDYLMTHDNDLLNMIPNSHLFEFGTCWIKDYNFPTKTFSVSTLVGGKSMVEGHRLRHQIWLNENKITNIPTRFFNSSNFSNGVNNGFHHPTIGISKTPLFNSQYYICIENVKRDNWFTEKLIDCLQTKTIPIYWGCPNINKWFNIDGFIICENINDMINKINSLTPETFEKMQPYIEENYNKSKQFIDINVRIEEFVKNKLK
jgi:hypothetical protein